MLCFNWYNAVSHAPRERVSWNRYYGAPTLMSIVTLHVSVWVEIEKAREALRAARSRSTWACELKCATIAWSCTNCPGHAPRERVSWNGLKIDIQLPKKSHAPRERVSWNVETEKPLKQQLSHAPRERVSWNDKIISNTKKYKASRSTWACELKLTRTLEDTLKYASRSTWACELKSNTWSALGEDNGHAPRERVSWNVCL